MDLRELKGRGRIARASVGVGLLSTALALLGPTVSATRRGPSWVRSAAAQAVERPRREPPSLLSRSQVEAGLRNRLQRAHQRNAARQAQRVRQSQTRPAGHPAPPRLPPQLGAAPNK